MERFLCPPSLSGIKGAYSEKRIYQFFGASAKTLACPSLSGIFRLLSAARPTWDAAG